MKMRSVLLLFVMVGGMMQGMDLGWGRMNPQERKALIDTINEYWIAHGVYPNISLDRLAEIVQDKGTYQDLVDQHAALMDAIEKKKVSVVKALLNGGAKEVINVYKKVEDIIYDPIALPLARAAQLGSYPMVQLLLDSGAEVDAVGSYRKNTALMFAVNLGAQKDRAKIAQLLLQRGANPNVEDYVRQTALTTHLDASFSQFWSLEIIRLLLDYGINPMIANKNKQTALDLYGLSLKPILKHYLFDRWVSALKREIASATEIPLDVSEIIASYVQSTKPSMQSPALFRKLYPQYEGASPFGIIDQEINNQSFLNKTKIINIVDEFNRALQKDAKEAALKKILGQDPMLLNRAKVLQALLNDLVK